MSFYDELASAIKRSSMSKDADCVLATIKNSGIQSVDQLPNLGPRAGSIICGYDVFQCVRELTTLLSVPGAVISNEPGPGEGPDTEPEPEVVVDKPKKSRNKKEDDS